MKARFSRRALFDLAKLGRESRLAFGPGVALALEAHIRKVIARLEALPKSAHPIVERPGVRVVPLGKYPYKVFYEMSGDEIEILHIRHTSRRPWRGRR